MEWGGDGAEQIVAVALGCDASGRGQRSWRRALAAVAPRRRCPRASRGRVTGECFGTLPVGFEIVPIPPYGFSTKF
jgi:hypothetical protein